MDGTQKTSARPTAEMIASIDKNELMRHVRALYDEAICMERHRPGCNCSVISDDRLRSYSMACVLTLLEAIPWNTIRKTIEEARMHLRGNMPISAKIVLDQLAAEWDGTSPANSTE